MRQFLEKIKFYHVKRCRKRQDSINFLFSIDALGRHGARLSPTNICLDSAHDNNPACRLLDHWGINALIDINRRGGSENGLPDSISPDKEAKPLCQDSFRMCSWGYDKNKDAHKLCYPLASGKVKDVPALENVQKAAMGVLFISETVQICGSRVTVSSIDPSTMNVLPVSGSITIS